MLKWAIIVGLVVIVAVVGYLATHQGPIDTGKTGTQGPIQAIEVKSLKITGPYTHNNLTIYLIHGKDTDKEDYLTLEDALAQKQAVVYETKDVNNLQIENLSDKPVYVQAGDIVKGGDQDRTLAKDFIVPPRSGKMSIASFCVESGRWHGREGESRQNFESGGGYLANKDLKLAAKQKGDQSAVWDKVAKEQEKLAGALGQSVQSGESKSSYQLSLENKKLQETTEDYIKAFSKIIEEQNDAVGFAFAINGKLNSADVYGSNKLFKKLWPKLLKASSVEAIAEYKKDLKFDTLKVDVIKECFEDAEKGKSSDEKINAHTKMITQETDKNLLFETQNEGQTIHKNYIKK